MNNRITLPVLYNTTFKMVLLYVCLIIFVPHKKINQNRGDPIGQPLFSALLNIN